MAIVGGLDVHRGQITFDCLDSDSGQVQRGRIVPATRDRFRAWLRELPRPAVPAVEGCTGWRFIVEECRAAGVEVQLAEPPDTAAADGPKHRARTDRADAAKIRHLPAEDRLPHRPRPRVPRSHPGSLLHPERTRTDPRYHQCQQLQRPAGRLGSSWTARQTRPRPMHDP
ncbi:hypothetical protein GCM10010358_65990 [Streptomyces minutiscleroticus]|uniref:Transposase n=1 Tax=Streptomyces minutiscleroticus TaxID=68238 RepID=A0A918U740_9ACTN|nr:hypothetical protein [Streptomyces minutiscleroticus]GGY03034.1 hypothetical protein GCM10010358_65990 [Streptomyces minutiscleroticus]